jgi:hypothetical protein
MLELRQSSLGQSLATAGVVLAALVCEFLSQAFLVTVGAAVFDAAASSAEIEVFSIDGATAHQLVAILADICFTISTFPTMLSPKENLQLSSRAWLPSLAHQTQSCQV